MVHLLTHLLQALCGHRLCPIFLPCFGIVRLVTGPLGTGKSYFGVRMAVRGLKQGALVATNFDMVDDWTDQVVRHGHIRKRTARLDARAADFARRYERIHTMEDLRRLRVAPEEPWCKELDPVPGVWSAAELAERGMPLDDPRLLFQVGPDQFIVRRWQVKEGSMVVILDEAHRWMNARSWSKEGREHLLEYFALARKRGMVIYLLAQRAENLDVQVRELFEDHIHLKNLRRSMRIFGMNVWPFNTFVAGWYNHAYEKECVRTDRYFLGWDKRLYDTMDTISFHEGEARENVTYLPHPPQAPQPPQVPPPPSGGAALRSEELAGEAGSPLPPAVPVPTLEGDPSAPVDHVDPAL